MTVARTGNKVSFFGVAFDPMETEDGLYIKREIARMGSEALAFRDPFDAMAAYMSDAWDTASLTSAGKMEVESWLTPCPGASDLPRLTAGELRSFNASGGAQDYAQRANRFVKDHLGDAIPAMVGIDHSTTAGVLEAIAERYGPENVTVVILDSHLDAIPPSVRAAALHHIQAMGRGSDFGADNVAVPSVDGGGDAFGAGSFVGHLLERGVILPANLKFVGLTEYAGSTWLDSLPLRGLDPNDPALKRTFEIFRALEAAGVELLTKSEIRHRGINQAVASLRPITTPYVYISLDIDVAAISAVYGARLLNAAGLSELELYEAAVALDAAAQNGVALAGLDVMETDVHRAGTLLPDGRLDRTYEIEANFVRLVLAGWGFLGLDNPLPKPDKF